MDILLISEAVWCTLWLRMMGIDRALAHTGGIIASGYAALKVSTWFTNAFVPPTSPVFRWLESHITTDADTVSTLSPFLPPVPAWSGIHHSQWIAMHVIRGVLFVGITLSIFTVFAITAYLTEALWDTHSTEGTSTTRGITTVMGVFSGIYLAVLTATLLTNLAWIQSLPFLSSGVRNAFILHVITKLPFSRLN